MTSAPTSAPGALPRPKVLVVDDDKAVRESLRRSLEFNGYDVAVASDGAEALAETGTQHPDVIIMDVMMPRLDGIEATKALRAAGNDVPVLVLTARDAVGERVEGLDAGADDYLTKPFALAELLARLRALLRRAVPLDDGELDGIGFADLTMDLATREVRRSDRHIELTRTEFTLLEMFCAARGGPRSARVHPRRGVGLRLPTTANSLEVYVGYLRRKTEAEGEPRLIHTVRGIGYVLKEAWPVPGVRRLAGLTGRWEARRWHYRRSLASRVALLTTIAVGLSLALLSLAARRREQQLQRSLDASLQTRAVKAVEGQALQQLANKDLAVPSWALGAADVRIIFIDSLGGVSSADRGPALVPGQPEVEVARGLRPRSLRTMVSDGTHYRVVTVPAQNGQALMLAQSLEPQLRTLHRLAAVLFAFAGLGVVIAALAGWGVARNGLRPVRRLTHAIEEKARTEELSRLPVEGDDEIARLAGAFNQLLAALSASRDRQRQLVADAGHELRTPLTSLRTNLDLLTQADDAGGLPAGARAELLADVRGQQEELTAHRGPGRALA
ncbi:MAG: response regulator [Nocardioides sp.]